MDIPADLVSAVAEQRVIPFVGAGFSALVGLPDWNQLLARLASETDGSLPYDDLKRHTGGDFLQIAEYLYLKSDRRIGPLRHVIERGLPAHANPTLSAAHIELVNLGAPQIYTTNYDDLIESTYRALSLPVNVVALGKDVAVAAQQATQVVKYHGDLRHESTLVLTESSYFRRLDFESAMDVKFRADLLGRSVLFMGYSFRDINIRLIWFKLNQMMEDIPNADRRQSYIVRIESNPVLEELYEAVGLRTIVLDPRAGDNRGRRTPISTEGEVSSLGEFLAQLTKAASSGTGSIPGTDRALFASEELVERAERECEALLKSANVDGYLPPRRSLSALMQRGIPPALNDRVEALVARALPVPPRGWRLSYELIRRTQAHGPSSALTMHVVRILLRTSSATASATAARSALLAADDIDWAMVWGSTLDEAQAKEVLDKLESEIHWHRGGQADYDIAYAADAVARVKRGILVEAGQTELRERAGQLLGSAAELYPAIESLHLPFGPPDVAAVLAEIDERKATLPEMPDLEFDFDPDIEELEVPG